MSILTIALFILVIVLGICAIMNNYGFDKRLLEAAKNSVDIDRNLTSIVKNHEERLSKLEEKC